MSKPGLDKAGQKAVRIMEQAVREVHKLNPEGGVMVMFVVGQIVDDSAITTAGGNTSNADNFVHMLRQVLSDFEDGETEVTFTGPRSI